MNTVKLVRDAMSPVTATLAQQATLVEAVLEMQRLNLERLPVTSAGQVVGLLTAGDIRRALPDTSAWDAVSYAGRTLAGEVMHRPLLSASPQDPLEQAVGVLDERGVKSLPVLEQGRLVGMLTLADVLRAATTQARLTWGSVQQHMTRHTICLEAQAPASEAAAKLKVSGLRVMPVLENGSLVGVLHRRDLDAATHRRAVGHGDTILADQFFLDGLTVRDFMRPPETYVLDTAPLRDAMAAMLKHGVYGLPVISEGGRVLGVLTISDVLWALLERSTPPA
ncbi:hypothetical protein DKM44_14660 [Deinococcus irradiatisoli]|uniref:CBS domain-containing protein n=1 Tax=Deinococcus irradiatisoli TaxID=2202254 RepID=A0A2Z3JGN0_9DEIO|nr:CBS domain-containing protein [Deinococcus irradiatisoli]AWN24317.1 hypothetical protein DKM44_14660 [Deinococcus irradiatisoli]